MNIPASARQSDGTMNQNEGKSAAELLAGLRRKCHWTMKIKSKLCKDLKETKEFYEHSLGFCNDILNHLNQYEQPMDMPMENLKARLSQMCEEYKECVTSKQKKTIELLKRVPYYSEIEGVLSGHKPGIQYQHVQTVPGDDTSSLPNTASDRQVHNDSCPSARQLEKPQDTDLVSTPALLRPGQEQTSPCTISLGFNSAVSPKQDAVQLKGDPRAGADRPSILGTIQAQNYPTTTLASIIVPAPLKPQLAMGINTEKENLEKNTGAKPSSRNGSGVYDQVSRQPTYGQPKRTRAAGTKRGSNRSVGISRRPKTPPKSEVSHMLAENGDNIITATNNNSSSLTIETENKSVSADAEPINTGTDALNALGTRANDPAETEVEAEIEMGMKIKTVGMGSKVDIRVQAEAVAKAGDRSVIRSGQVGYSTVKRHIDEDYDTDSSVKGDIGSKKAKYEE